mmetsp:Transcript_23626/g.38844  ORF Transcript_23626/g.38844 Transcript_23626/m.38844 type:complete len:234 (+) Transcript_23626:1275-1976(+)
MRSEDRDGGGDIEEGAGEAVKAEMAKADGSIGRAAGSIISPGGTKRSEGGRKRSEAGVALAGVDWRCDSRETCDRDWDSRDAALAAIASAIATAASSCGVGDVVRTPRADCGWECGRDEGTLGGETGPCVSSSSSRTVLVLLATESVSTTAREGHSDVLFFPDAELLSDTEKFPCIDIGTSRESTFGTFCGGLFNKGFVEGNFCSTVDVSSISSFCVHGTEDGRGTKAGCVLD